MTASPTAAPEDPLVAALNAEYAAVFAYGLLGAHVPEPRRSQARQALDAHRVGRDWLRARITDAGGKPPPAAAAYATAPVTNEAQAAALAVTVELALVPRWADATGAVTSEYRPFSSAQAQGCAVRAMSWGAAAQPFPGSATTAGAAASDSASPSGAESASPSGADSASPSGADSASPSGADSASPSVAAPDVSDQLTEVIPPAPEEVVIP